MHRGDGGVEDELLQPHAGAQQRRAKEDGGRITALVRPRDECRAPLQVGATLFDELKRQIKVL